MELPGLSGIVTISDQRSHINIETLRGKNLAEIHGVMSEVCVYFTANHSTVHLWAIFFWCLCEHRR